MTEKELTNDELEQAAGALKDARAKESDLDPNAGSTSGWPQFTQPKPKPTITGVEGAGEPTYGGA